MFVCLRCQGILHDLKRGISSQNFARSMASFQPFVSKQTCSTTGTTPSTSNTSWRRSLSMSHSASPGTSIYLVVGLGNADLLHTRHSVGMRVVDKLADSLDVRWSRQQFLQAMVATANISPDVDIVLLKPKVPMNINGQSVLKAAKHYSVAPSRVYLVHDELDKPLGISRIKEGGSANGHNGVKSVINSLQTQEMTRLMIGIDRPKDKRLVIDYVLERFRPDEKPIIETVITEGLHKLLRRLERDVGMGVDLVSLITTPNMEGG